MNVPMTTGHAARVLDTTEPRLNDLIRRGKIDPEPPIDGGRRLWSLKHLIAAADSCGGIRSMAGILDALARGELADDAEGVPRGE